jgi:hypothetical protein
MLLALAIPTALSAAQTPTCDAELTWAADFAARNYAGFADKVTPATRPAYDSLLFSLRADAVTARSPGACAPILQRWIGFFRDRHLGWSRTNSPSAPAAGQSPESPESIRARFAHWDRVAVDDAKAQASLSGQKTLDRIEGIWSSADGNYRVAILRDTSGDRDFVMTVLRADSVYWLPGQVKARLTRDGAEYRTQFYMRDHSEQSWTASVERNALRFSSGSAWFRDFPRRADDLAPLERRTIADGRFAAYDVAPGTVLVRVPTFNDPKGIDSLFQVEGARIRTAERLIIDVRGNGGGSDYNYREFTPLLYTGPMQMVGMDALATDDNIASQRALAADTTYPAGQRQELAGLASRMEAARGGWWRGSDGTHRERGALEKPRVVAVVTDQGCASSCEQFLLMARQSAKVTIYGSNTAGVLDYGNVRSTTMPGGTLVLSRPITRSRRLPAEPIDNIGIAPNVRVPAETVVVVPWVIAHMKP